MPENSRLQDALKTMGYENAREPHHRSNLVLSIQLFAGIQKDDGLETECEMEIKRIRAEIAERNSKITV